MIRGLGFCVRLLDRGGEVFIGGESWRLSAAVTSTLSGDVTIGTIVDSNGSPTPWVLASGTTAGVYAAPGSGQNGGAPVFYKLADIADTDKVTVMGVPIRY